MTNLISMDKRYKTRDGQDARVLCIDNNYNDTDFPVIALIDGETNSFTISGGFYSHKEDDMDLIETPQEYSIWVELYKSNGGIASMAYGSEGEMFNSIQASKDSSTEYEYTLLATKKITITEGESCL